MGSSTRLDLGTSKRQLFQVSPDAYRPNFNVTAQSASKWGFGSETRNGMANKDAGRFPGAGAY